ncbi:MAG: sugar ABC transporter substrate-binding protein [Candidatus Dormiibacterota bacterium]
MEEQGPDLVNVAKRAVNRRTFLGMAGVAVSVPALLAACGGSSPSGSTGGGSGDTSGQPIKFWNQPWGNTTFNTLDGTITEGYKPAKGYPKATYQVIQWANFLQTYTSAVTSNTGPACSSGGGTQAFLFAHQGYIQYADDLLGQWKSNGLYDDFLPGLLDTMKTKQGYAGIPYNLDMRVGWYSPSLLQQAGASVPTDWQSYMDTCAALKKIGVYGFGVGSGSGNYTGSHIMVSFMLNNGGGLFDKAQQPNCVTRQNIEAMNYVLELVHKGYVDPACPSYTSANVQSQWTAGKFGMGFDTAGLSENVGGTVGAAMQLLSPLKGPSGKKGAIYFPNNIMMYKHNPTVKGTEAFLTYYYKNMHPLWTENTGIGLPVLKSITKTSAFKSSPINAKVINEWLPISHPWAYPGSSSNFYNVTAVDGTPLMGNFCQAILGGKTDAKTALTTLQNAIKAQIASNG